MLSYSEMSKQEEGKQYNVLFLYLQIWERNCLISPLDSEAGYQNPHSLRDLSLYFGLEKTHTDLSEVQSPASLVATSRTCLQGLCMFPLMSPGAQTSAAKVVPRPLRVATDCSQQEKAVE